MCKTSLVITQIIVYNVYRTRKELIMISKERFMELLKTLTDEELEKVTNFLENLKPKETDNNSQNKGA